VDKLNRLADELPGSAVFPTDMSNENSVRQMIADVDKKLGRLDVLVNNAGRGMYWPLGKMDVAEYRALLALNLVGPLVAMQAAIPIMRRQGGGAIVNISSGTALMYAPGLGGYSASKRALNGLTLTARGELAADGIKVSVVYPYVTKTDFYREWITDGANLATTVDDVTAGRPPADSAEYVAGLIMAAITSGEGEIFAHEWMKKMMK
jgi:NAD(P)-dependent dehydrogenase (short-subunit alcohol dehydrogenase family)